MPYDEVLAERIHRALAGRRDVIEKQMFGGVAYLSHGNMCFGIVRHELMVRVGPARYLAALAEPHTRRMDFTGTPLTGMIYVGAEGIADDASLKRWLDEGLAFVSKLPPRGARRRAAEEEPGRRSAGAGASSRRASTPRAAKPGSARRVARKSGAAVARTSKKRPAGRSRSPKRAKKASGGATGSRRRRS